MPKGRVYLFIFCGITIILFFVLIYLMGTVDPPPLVHHHQNRTYIRIHGRRDNNQLDNYYYNSEFEEEAQHGLKKTINDTIILTSKNYDVKPTHTTLKHKSSAHTHLNIEPFLSPTTLRYGTNKSEIKLVNDTVRNTVISLVKGHRRSIDNTNRNVTLHISGSIILKILNDNGDARVIIKLNPYPTKKNILYRGNNDTFQNKDHNFNNNIIYDKNTDFGNDSEIIVMPNNTVIYNDNGGNKSDKIHFTVVDKGNKTSTQINYTTEDITGIKLSTNSIKPKIVSVIKKKNVLPLKVTVNNETKLLLSNSPKITTPDTDFYWEFLKKAT